MYPDIFESATFSFRMQKYPRPHVACSNRIRLSTRIIRIHSSTQGSSALKCLQSMRLSANLLCSPSTLCRHIGLLFGERLDTLFTSSDSKISGFTSPHVIGFVADLFFPLLERINFFSGFAVEFAGYVWTVAVSGKKKLRIRK